MLRVEDRVLAEEGFLLHVAVQLRVVYVAGAVLDLTVEEPDIEDVVRRIYAASR